MAEEILDELPPAEEQPAEEIPAEDPPTEEPVKIKKLLYRGKGPFARKGGTFDCVEVETDGEEAKYLAEGYVDSFNVAVENEDTKVQYDPLVQPLADRTALELEAIQLSIPVTRDTPTNELKAAIAAKRQ